MFKACLGPRRNDSLTIVPYLPRCMPCFFFYMIALIFCWMFFLTAWNLDLFVTWIEFLIKFDKIDMHLKLCLTSLMCTPWVASCT